MQVFSRFVGMLMFITSAAFCSTFSPFPSSLRFLIQQHLELLHTLQERVLKCQWQGIMGDLFMRLTSKEVNTEWERKTKCGYCPFWCEHHLLVNKMKVFEFLTSFKPAGSERYICTPSIFLIRCWFNISYLNLSFMDFLFSFLSLRSLFFYAMFEII